MIRIFQWSLHKKMMGVVIEELSKAEHIMTVATPSYLESDIEQEKTREYGRAKEKKASSVKKNMK